MNWIRKKTEMLGINLLHFSYVPVQKLHLHITLLCVTFNHFQL